MSELETTTNAHDLTERDPQQDRPKYTPGDIRLVCPRCRGQLNPHVPVICPECGFDLREIREMAR